MKKIYPILMLLLITMFVKAQQLAPGYEPYGKIDIADLEMKSCDFEPDANAEILFDKGIIKDGILKRHVRIKIFNQQGTKEANIHIANITNEGLQGETINLINGKIQITPLDKKLVYIEKINRFLSDLTFALPNVKPGSIIEYTYIGSAYVNWYFQSSIPTRYSEIKTSFLSNVGFKYIPHINQPFVKNEGQSYEPIQDKVLVNIHSLPREPYMDAQIDNLQRMQYIGYNPNFNGWKMIATLLLENEIFGGQLGRHLSDQESIIDKAKSLNSKDEKIAYVFNTVRDRMKWNNSNFFFTKDGTVSAWDKKIGNSTEINLILYHLLKKTGISAYPMLVSTKSNGKINPIYPNLFAFNKTVVYVPIDTTDADKPKYYVLDATDKFNMYNLIPKDELNSFEFRIDPSYDYTKTIFIENTKPALQYVALNAEIKPEGTMTGTAEITSSSYNRIENIGRYKTDGETKFNDYLRDSDINLKITSLKLQNMDTDTLPLVQDVGFTLNMPESDSSYIYFNPNLFITPHKNPFLSKNRYNDIDFGYRNNVTVYNTFKIPSVYKIYSLPKNVNMIMPDTSITFRRTIAEQEGIILVHYTINYRKTIYFKEDYSEFYEFFKKMYEMMNEQIVLKKL